MACTDIFTSVCAACQHNSFIYLRTPSILLLVFPYRSVTSFLRRPPHLFALSCTYSFIQVGSDLASYPWRRYRGTPFASNLFFFFVFYFRYYILRQREERFPPVGIERSPVENCVYIGPLLNGLPHAHIWRILSGMATNTKAMDVIRCPGRFLVSDCGLSCVCTSKCTLSRGFELFQLRFIYIYIYMPQRIQERSHAFFPARAPPSPQTHGFTSRHKWPVLLNGPPASLQT